VKRIQQMSTNDVDLEAKAQAEFPKALAFEETFWK